MSCEIVKIPVKARLWKSKASYIAVVNDAAAVELLEQYVGSDVMLVIEGIKIRARLTKLRQKDQTYIAFFLPNRLSPTWEAMRSQNDEHPIMIIINESKEGGGS